MKLSRKQMEISFSQHVFESSYLFLYGESGVAFSYTVERKVKFEWG